MPPTDKTSSQVSLKSLLGMLTVIGLTVAIVTHPYTVGDPLALVWVMSLVAYLSLSLYGAIIANKQHATWQTELNRQIFLGVSPCVVPFVALLLGLVFSVYSPHWLEAICSFVILSAILVNPFVVLIGNLSSNFPVVGNSRVISWIRITVILNAVLPLVFLALTVFMVLNQSKRRSLGEAGTIEFERSIDRLD